MRALRIPTDESAPITELQLARLEDYQTAVGGSIEPVDIPSIGITIYVNDEGLLRQLPLNSRATFLWWYFVSEARQRAMLVGQALLVGLPDRNGDSTDVPSPIADMLLRDGVWCIEVKTHDESEWHRGRSTYADYFEALVWAMVTLERWTEAEDVRIVPVTSEGSQALA